MLDNRLLSHYAKLHDCHSSIYVFFYTGLSMLGLGLTPAKTTTTDDSNRLLINGNHHSDNHMDDHKVM